MPGVTGFTRLRNYGVTFALGILFSTPALKGTLERLERSPDRFGFNLRIPYGGFGCLFGGCHL